MMRSLRCSVSLHLLLQALTIVRPGASSPYYRDPRRNYYIPYEDPDIFGEDQCSEVAEIKEDIRALKSLVEGLRQKLDPDFKPAVTEDNKDAVQCPEGFQYLSEARGCYKVIMEKHAWSSAMEQCQSLNPNAHLISIESREESEAVTKYLNKQFASRRTKYTCHRYGHPFGNTAFWTSGQRANISDCSSEFVWKTTAEEVAFNYTQWNGGEPNCYGGREECAEMFVNRQSSFWNDIPCETRRCPMCEYDALKPSASTENPGPLAEQTEAPKEESSDAVQCSEGFEYLSEARGCYKVIMEKHNWHSAMEQCQSLNPNAHLISIESREESEAVTKYLNKQMESPTAKHTCQRHGYILAHKWTAFWTSGQRANMTDCSSEFVWKATADGEATFTYTQWGEGQPDCEYRGVMDGFVEMLLDGQVFWNDELYIFERCPICEYALKSGASTETPEPLAEQTEAPQEGSSGF